MTVLASGVLLYRIDGPRVRLLLLRNRRLGHWGFPKGRRDEGDAHEVATALREVAEEVGYDGLQLHPTFRVTSEYRVREEDGSAYAKRVVYFLARAPAAEPSLSAEHSEAAWANEEQARQLLAYDQLRDVARAAFHAAR